MKRILTTTTVLLLTFVATLLASGERGAESGADVHVTGRVLHDATGDPIAGAVISVERTSHRAISRATGEYSLVLPAGAVSGSSFTLTVRSPGFVTQRVVVDAGRSTAFVDIRLRPGRELEEEGLASAAERDAAAVGPPAPPPAPAMDGVRAAFMGVGVSGSIAATSMAPHTRSLGGQWNTESYNHFEDNEFQSVSGNPLSTFSIDVDRASYSNIRRFLLDGELPPKDAVRTEEMINYFRYSYPAARGNHPFAVGTELGSAPWRSGHLLLRVGLASPEVQTENLPPSNFVFLIDVSGSMQSEDKLPLVKRSLRLLVEELRPRDRVAIVVYAGAAGLVLPSTPGNEKTRILNAIDRLEAGGSTAGGEGLRLAYGVARENHLERGNNRVILATDGDFNVGVSSDAEMVRLVEEKRGQGTFLTVLGFGTGNLQDSKMEQMADHGNGNYAYIDSLLEARKVLVSEMGGTLLTVATDVKLQIEFNPERVRAYRLIGYENRVLAAEDFNDDSKDAGELGAGHTVTALYEIVPVGVDTDVEIRGTDPLRYQTPQERATNAAGDELAYVRVRYKRPGTDRSLLLEQPVAHRVGTASPDLSFAAAVAGFGMLLRDSEHRGSLTVERVLELARAGRGEDREGYRAEFSRLVETYRSLKRGEE